MTPTLGLALLFTFATVDDWPHWRGPARDGVSTETAWSSTGRPDASWTRQLGAGYSTFAIVDGRLLTAGYDEDAQEDVFWCLDAASGEVLWTHRYAAEPLANYHGGGTLSGPTVDGELVYSVNRFGRAFCRKLEDGEVVWERDYGKELELPPSFHGFSASPLALEDQLILVLGGTVLGVAKEDGEVRWQTEPYGDGGYANPAPFELRGRPCLAVFAGVGLLVLDRTTGDELYRVPWKSGQGGVNAATPIVMGDRIFFSSAYNMGSALIELGEDPEPEVLWSSKRMRCKVGDVVLWEDHLYGFDESMLKCLNLEGQEQWRVRGLGMGSLSIAGGRLLVLSSKGDLIVAEAAPEEFRELSRAKVLETGGTSWTAPVLVDGRIYCRSSLGQLVCRDHQGAATSAVASEEASASLPAAIGLLAAHAEAIGGEAALRAHSSFRATGMIEILGAGITRNTMSIERMVPNLWHLNYENGFSAVNRGFDGELGWQLDPIYGDELYTGDKLAEMQSTLGYFHDLDYAKTYTSMRTTGTTTFADRSCWVVEAVTAAGTKRSLYLDRETHLLLGRDAETESMVVYTDYAGFGGVMMPRRTTVLIPDTGAEETFFITEVTFDVVEASVFERPGKVLRMLRTPEEIEAANEAARVKYAAYLGEFVADFEPYDGAHMEVLIDDGGLALDIPGQQAFALLPPNEEGRWYFALTDRASLVFLEDDAGAVTGIQLTDPRGTNDLPRADDD